MKTIQTVRKNIESEVSSSLSSDGLLMEDGTLDERVPSSLRLASTKEEFISFLFERPNLRPGFVLNEKELKIPVFISKADKNSQKFISDMREKSRSHKNETLVLNGFHIIKRVPINNSNVPENSINKDGTLNREVAKTIHEISFLKPMKRETFLNAVELIIRNKKEFHILEETSSYDILCYSVCENDKIIKIFNKSHYEISPPKLVIIDTNISDLNPCSVVRLLLVHNLAFDLVVASYKSYSSIENYFPEGLYDVHFFEEQCDNNYEVSIKRKQKIKISLGMIITASVLIAKFYFRLF